MQTKTKIIIGVVALIVILLIAFFIYKYSTKAGGTTQTTSSTSTTTGSGGLADLLNSNWFSGLFGGGSSDPTSDPNYCKNHPNDITNCNSNTDCFNGCSSSHIGYDCNGNPTPNC